jgi:hypothetical protein
MFNITIDSKELKMKKGIRQGDVLVRPVKKIRQAKPILAENDLHILAHGEVTGHHHSIQDRDNITMFQSNNSRYLEVLGESVNLVHQEHTALPIAPGKYKVELQRINAAGAHRRVLD